MKVGINLATDSLRRNLEQAINGSGCPPCIVRPVLEVILAQVKTAEAEEISREAEQYQVELEKERQAAQAAKETAGKAESAPDGKHPAEG